MNIAKLIIIILINIDIYVFIVSFDHFLNTSDPFPGSIFAMIGIGAIICRNNNFTALNANSMQKLININTTITPDTVDIIGK